MAHFEIESAKVIKNFVRQVIFLEQTTIIVIFSGQLTGQNCTYKATVSYFLYLQSCFSNPLSN